MSVSSDGFQNAPVAPEALPDFSALTLNPVSGKFRYYLMLSAFLYTLTLTAGGGTAVYLLWGPVPGLVVASLGLLLMLISGLHAWLDPRYRGWAVREHDLIARQGVVWRKTIVLPLLRVQHVETASGPLERGFGLMRLQCFGAGGASADVVFHGLPTETALRIRAHLLAYLRQSPGGGADNKTASS